MKFILILLFFIYFYFSLSEKVKINFNIKFFCGSKLSNGRLTVRVRQGEIYFFAKFTTLLDIVINNGEFNETLYISFPFHQINSFEVLFRTNCYLLKDIDECCINDFKFIGCYSILGGKQVCETRKGEEICDKMNTWISSDYTEGAKSFNFEMFDPLKRQKSINLTDLLLNEKNYDQWIKMTRCADYNSYQAKETCTKKGKIMTSSSCNKIFKFLCKEDPFETMDDICNNTNFGLLKTYIKN
ncbi:hypothetical protein Mgra_00007869 [Meloidogyne graminicola]|uniref:C-type lectin domain-containing protein n=1 Tax=Meloidogyne graminicola TaxID=189291 RepID=A0A8S9ZHI3_9BILA|nr:hypothetical protein Mgra_00007869 [Meloidogyne graminicola]